MDAFTPLRSKAVPLLVDNIDTDVITPIGRVLEGREAMVTYAFEPLRFDADGAVRRDSPLNHPDYAGARVLIAGANFACGSSRETAVWAIMGMGFRAVIAPSFGDIFFANCFKNGVLPIVLPVADVEALAAFAARGGEIAIDLEGQSVGADDEVRRFEVSPVRKEALLLGLDELGLMLRRVAVLDAFVVRDRQARPWAYLPPADQRP